MPVCAGCGREFDSEKGVKAHQRHHATDCSTEDGVKDALEDQNQGGDKIQDDSNMKQEGSDQEEETEDLEEQETDTQETPSTDQGDNRFMPEKDAPGGETMFNSGSEPLDPSEEEESTEPEGQEEGGKAQDQGGDTSSTGSSTQDIGPTEAYIFHTVINKAMRGLFGFLGWRKPRKLTDQELGKAAKETAPGFNMLIPPEWRKVSEKTAGGSAVLEPHIRALKEGETPDQAGESKEESPAKTEEEPSEDAEKPETGSYEELQERKLTS